MNSLQTVRLSEIREVWESFSGWYWFVTEYHEGSLAFGLVRGWETEWGYFDLNELRQLSPQSKVWKVPKKNWALCPCVKDDAALYSSLKVAPARGETGYQQRPGQFVLGGTVPRRGMPLPGVGPSNIRPSGSSQTRRHPRTW